MIRQILDWLAPKPNPKAIKYFIFAKGGKWQIRMAIDEIQGIVTYDKMFNSREEAEAQVDRWKS